MSLRAADDQLWKLFHGRQRFLFLYRRGEIADRKLRIDVKSQIRNTQTCSLSSRGAFEAIVRENDRRLAGLQNFDPVAHGAGGAGASGREAYERVIGLFDEPRKFGLRRRCPSVFFVDADH